MRPRILRWDGETDSLINVVRSEFEHGRPVVIPTDTLYGLAAPWKDPDCIRTIFEIKRRPDEKTLAVCVSNMEGAEKLAFIDERVRGIMNKNLPGQVTFVLGAKSVVPDTFLKSGKVALRIPESDCARVLALEFGPLALTSANISGSREAIYHCRHDQ